MPSENQVLYKTQAWVNKTDTKHLTYEKNIKPLLETCSFERWLVKLSQTQAPQETNSILFPLLDSFKVGFSYSHRALFAWKQLQGTAN